MGKGLVGVLIGWFAKEVNNLGAGILVRPRYGRAVRVACDDAC
jgi:hypothetical protein